MSWPLMAKRTYTNTTELRITEISSVFVICCAEQRGIKNPHRNESVGIFIDNLLFI